MARGGRWGAHRVAVARGFVPAPDDGEQLILLVEATATGDAQAEGTVAETIRASVTARTAIRPHTVVLLEPGTLPRTSSGKLRRREALRLFLAGELLRPAGWGRGGSRSRCSARRLPLLAREVAMRADLDVAVVGGGPAGLATATFAARAGLDHCGLREKRRPTGQGVRRGAHAFRPSRPGGAGGDLVIEPAECSLSRHPLPPRGRRLAEGRLPAGGGRGSDAPPSRRRSLAVPRRPASSCAGAARSRAFASRGGIVLDTSAGEVTARFVVAADGVSSRLRQLAGLEPAARGTALRHAPALPRSAVEPIGRGLSRRRRRGLRDADRPVPGRDRLPLGEGCGVPARHRWRGSCVVPGARRTGRRRRARLATAGAGPLASRRRVPPTGWPWSATPPGASTRSSARACRSPWSAPRSSARCSLRPSATGHPAALRLRAFPRSRAFTRYTLVCHALLALARRPYIRRRVVRFLGSQPRLFDRLIAVALA